MMFRDKQYKPKGLRDNIGFTGYLRINPSIIPDGVLTLGEQQHIRRRDIPKARGTIRFRSLSKPEPRKLSEAERNKKLYESEQAILRAKDTKEQARKDYYASKNPEVKAEKKDIVSTPKRSLLNKIVSKIGRK